MLQTLKDFLKLESSSGVILLIAAIFAMLIANSPLASLYNLFIDMPVEIRIGAFFIGKPLLLWINDGLMAIFFFLVGLELKREILEGEFADINKIVLPAVAAVGGIAMPALIYTAINWHNPHAQQGWAIPAATDIAFALAILALLGKRIPLSLKVFLVSLAIFDDIGAILIIALFYTQNLSLNALGISAVCIVLLFVINRKRVIEFTPYLLIGILMWISLLKSGVHATLAGVLLAFFIPMRNPKKPEASPVKTLEHDLHTAVAYGILPLFAFANAGVDLGNFGFEDLLHPVSLGVASGLFIGKQLGVFLFCWVAIKLRCAKLPNDTSWAALYGVALLSGVGFTMSLFIGSLAFETSQHNQLFDERIGIIAGSLLSGIAGYLVLKYSYRHADFSNNE